MLHILINVVLCNFNKSKSRRGCLNKSISISSNVPGQSLLNVSKLLELCIAYIDGYYTHRLPRVSKKPRTCRSLSLESKPIKLTKEDGTIIPCLCDECLPTFYLFFSFCLSHIRSEYHRKSIATQQL